MSIISAYEVVKKTPVSRDYPTHYMCTILDDLEESLLRDCFGNDFYEYLKDHVISYSNVTEYLSGETYQLNAKVVLDGCIFKSVSNNNDETPYLSDKWEIAQKFDETCLNNIWPKLSVYLSYQILASTLTYATNAMNSKGATNFVSDNTGIKSTGKDGIFLNKKQLIDHSVTVFDNLKFYLVNNANTCSSYKLISFIKGTACETGVCKQGRKRIRRIYYKYT